MRYKERKNKNNMNIFVSCYNNKFDTNNKTTESLVNIAKLICISHPHIIEIINRIRNCTDHDERRRLKGTLPLFTCCGTFSHRASLGLLEYSNYFCLDFDGIDSDVRRWQLKTSFSKLPYAFMVFDSPSKGLKFIGRHDNNNPAYHKALFQDLCKIPEFNVPELDTVCSDLARGTFISYDPDLYFNLYAEAYHFQYTPTISQGCIPTPILSQNTVILNHNLSALVNNFPDGWTDRQILDWNNNHFWKYHPKDYLQGNRMTALIRKAGRLCVWGVGYKSALNELLYRYTYRGLSSQDVQQAVDYSYERNVFGRDRQELLNLRNKMRK